MYARGATSLLATFLDSNPPSTQGWCARNTVSGPAHVLMGKYKDVNELATKMAQFKSNHGVKLRGWTQYTAAAIALAALFSRNQVEKTARIAHEDAVLRATAPWPA